ncbi:exo-alpha-sialidase [Actinomadura sp. GC306]|uniref:sialidase family protein n=1 Tax=Actinomadura sp. GC306 TaxID=2530367 RepID=UPI001045A59D|nr:sialidase family protein [Actinomadura sp. GC306]TDC67982.1 exo-alpha-sialidase [Actinomadura sp. GC306]
MTARTPEQDEARRTSEQEAGGSRQVRRRLTFGVAGDLADMPATLSPWQRAYEAWRAAGLKWGHGAPPREQRTAEAAETAETAAGAPEKPAPKKAARQKAAAKPAPEKSKLAKGKPEKAEPEKATPEIGKAEETEPEKSKPEKSKPEKAAPPKGAGKKGGGKKQAARKKAAPDPADVLVAGPGLAAARKGTPRRLRSRLAVAAGLAVLAGGAVFTVAQGESDSDGPGVPAAVAADALFPPDPAAETDGLVQDLAAVTAAGGTLVAVGTEGDGVPGRERSRFLFSVDAGRTWSPARLRAAGGTTAPAGDSPEMVTAGDRGWVALGRSPGGGTVAWTSDNAQTWTRHDLGAVFKPSDDVRGVARTATGFAAVGGVDDRAVAWISPDGIRWQRIEGIEGISGFDRVASSGSVLVGHGTYARKVTVKRGRRKVTRTVPAYGVWRSTDGGRTWARVNIPQSHGSYGPTKGLTFGPGGFATVREGRHTTGRGDKRRTRRFGLLFTSADGREWRAVSRFPGAGIKRFGGTPDGLAVLAHGAEGTSRILRTDDGRTWKAAGTVPGPVESSGLTVAAGGALAISGSQGDDAYLHGVDLRTVPGAVRPELAVRSLAGTPGRSVAVGSSNGAAAVWTSTDGQAWQRGRFPGAGGALSDVVEGAAGWLAVGRTSGDSPGPLAMTSRDGVVWEKAAFPAGPPPVAAAAGPAGYVAAAAGTIWRSADLRAWRRTGVDGTPADVTAAAGKYVAVGGKGRAPAVWTSPDGAKWTAAELPGGLAGGPLTGVAARGGVLVATGSDGAPLVSADGGTTWTAHGLGGDLNATAITATPHGFVLAASTSRGDAAVLTSADGATWRRLPVPGLAGAGERRLTALTTAGTSVLATGTTADAHGERPLLWKAPVPE